MSQRLKLPRWLYYTLPYLYMVAGMLVAFNLPNIWGIVSGLLLILAGAVVWRTRRVFNRASKRAAVHFERNSGNSNAHVDLAPLVWKTEYECGQPNIDAQHRKLFALGNALLNAIRDKQSKLDVELLLDDLISEAKNHFLTEETLMARAQHPQSPEHKAIHSELLARCDDLAARYHRDELRADDLYKFVVRDVVTGHILKEDLSFLAEAD